MTSSLFAGARTFATEEVTYEVFSPGTMLLIMGVSILLVAVSRILRRMNRRHHASSYLARAMVGVPEIYSITAREREGAVRELVKYASRLVRYPDERTILKAVLKREHQMSTGLVHGVAVPHARFQGLDHSFVLFARSPDGIEWDCMDQGPAHLIFLILSPEEEEHEQLHILAEIGECAENPDCLETLAKAPNCQKVTSAIRRTSTRRTQEESSP